MFEFRLNAIHFFSYVLYAIMAFINLVDQDVTALKIACMLTVLTYAGLIFTNVKTGEYYWFIINSLLAVAVLSTSILLAAYVLMGVILAGAVAVALMLMYEHIKRDMKA